MTDELNDLPVEPTSPAKKPYVRPQLHLLAGAGADGKNPFFAEGTNATGGTPAGTS